MSLLDKLQTGKSPWPRRVLLYGTHGIGKSTFGAMAEKPIFIQTEDGLGDIDCAKFPLAKCYKDVRDALIALHEGDHGFKTVVIDSLDWLEKHIFDDVCRRRSVQTIEDIGYGKGPVFALELWHEVLTALDSLRTTRQMTIILIAHSRTERFNNPETESYDRYVPSLNQHASAKVQEWCDEVFFATQPVYTRSEDQGFNRSRNQAISSGRRIIRTVERASHIAKNRLNLPEEIDLDYRVFAAYVRGEPPKPVEAETKAEDAA